MTQEPNDKVKVSYWTVFTDNGEYRLTEKELDSLLEAEGKNQRLVRFDEFVISIPFIKEIKHKAYIRETTGFNPIPSDEMKFIVSIDNRKMLS